jgi:NitT/TauT family transport system ATP-binding protein
VTKASGIQITGLNKYFKDRQVIRDLNLEIKPGSFVSIVGPSGCGKSTLLKLISDLEKPSSGQISLSQNKTRISFVFQDSNLLAWLSVYENIELPFKLDPSLRADLDVPKLIHEILVQVGLQDVANSFPHELSGGMKMRVSLARALVSRPQLLLMDEPFAALDEPTRFKMHEQLRKLWLQEGMTVIFVTHSIFEAAFLSERVVLLKGPGAEIKMDESLASLPTERPDSLRTSPQLNQIVEKIRQGLQV